MNVPHGIGGEQREEGEEGEENSKTKLLEDGESGEPLVEERLQHQQVERQQQNDDVCVHEGNCPVHKAASQGVWGGASEVGHHLVLNRPHDQIDADEQVDGEYGRHHAQKRLHVLHLLLREGSAILVLGQVQPGWWGVLPVGEGAAVGGAAVPGAIAQHSHHLPQGVCRGGLHPHPVSQEEVRYEGEGECEAEDEGAHHTQPPQQAAAGEQHDGATGKHGPHIPVDEGLDLLSGGVLELVHPQLHDVGLEPGQPQGHGAEHQRQHHTVQCCPTPHSLPQQQSSALALALPQQQSGYSFTMSGSR